MQPPLTYGPWQQPPAVLAEIRSILVSEPPANNPDEALFVEDMEQSIDDDADFYVEGMNNALA